MSLTRYAVDAVISDVKFALTLRPKQYKEYMVEIRPDLIYCLHATTIAPNVKLLVNRNYKPVGSTAPYGPPYADYEAATDLQIRLPKSQLENVSLKEVDEKYYLYHDGLVFDKKAGADYLAKVTALRALLR